MSYRKKVLVAGGAGFIGSNLAKALLEEGYSVDCVDSLITGRIASIDVLRSNKRFRFFKFDITDRDFFNTFAKEHYDEIYHLACPTGVPNIRVYGEEMLKTSSIGTDNILRLACTHNAKVIYTSSAEVYGDPQVFPQHEEYCGNVHPTGPRSAYEEGKRFAEALVISYVEKYQLDAKIVRIFNTFGIGMSPDDTRVIPRFLKLIKEGKKIVIYGDGKQTRTHLYVDDLVAGLLLVMRKGSSGEVYNIGGDKQLTIAELADLIKSLTTLTVDVEYHPHFIEDHSGRHPMVSKVKDLGWTPNIGVTEGLIRMLPSYGVPVRNDVHDFLKNKGIEPDIVQDQDSVVIHKNKDSVMTH
ncbi:MAG: NAD-dependent epimerase/dehydratase family protein [Thioalkalispiraceae bacterium]|jgi:nucleoside-diphosphate-sugar epimerase